MKPKQSIHTVDINLILVIADGSKQISVAKRASSARERSKLMNEQTKNSIRERPSTIDRVDFTQSLPID